MPSYNGWLLEVLLTLVLLVHWLEPLEQGAGCPEAHVLDFFAGQARLAKAARRIPGIQACAFDISYHYEPAAFDFNSAPGFTFL